jgi:hypothetical protein
MHKTGKTLASLERYAYLQSLFVTSIVDGVACFRELVTGFTR